MELVGVAVREVKSPTSAKCSPPSSRPDSVDVSPLIGKAVREGTGEGVSARRASADAPGILRRLVDSSSNGSDNNESRGACGGLAKLLPNGGFAAKGVTTIGAPAVSGEFSSDALLSLEPNPEPTQLLVSAAAAALAVTPLAPSPPELLRVGDNEEGGS